MRRLSEQVDLHLASISSRAKERDESDEMRLKIASLCDALNDHKHFG